MARNPLAQPSGSIDMANLPGSVPWTGAAGARGKACLRLLTRQIHESTLGRCDTAFRKHVIGYQLGFFAKILH